MNGYTQIFITEGERIGLSVDRTNEKKYVITSYDMGGDEISKLITPLEALELADALYDELGLGWLPYPENVPETNGVYIITFKLKGKLYEEAATYKNGTWSDMLGGIPNEDIVAYRKPSPYQPESEE